MSISKKSNLNGWHKNTELCVNVKTMLLNDVRMKVGKSYQGVLRRDSEGIVDEYLSRDPHVRGKSLRDTNKRVKYQINLSILSSLR